MTTQQINDADRNCAFSLVVSQESQAERSNRVTINVDEFAPARDYTIELAARDVPLVIQALTSALAHAREIGLASAEGV
jgi:hypothetical protein